MVNWTSTNVPETVTKPPLSNELRNFQEGVSKQDSTTKVIPTHCSKVHLQFLTPPKFVVQTYISFLILIIMVKQKNASTIQVDKYSAIATQHAISNKESMSLCSTNRGKNISWMLWLLPFTGAFHKILSELSEIERSIWLNWVGSLDWFF